LLSLKELSSQAKVPYETAVDRLEARGFKGVRPEAIAQEIAATNQVSAQRLYEIIQGPRDGGRGGGGRGPGKGGEAAGEAGKGAGHSQGGGQGGGRGGFGKGGGGGGAGWQTLAQYCTSKGIALTNAAARLQTKGIKFAPNQTLREIALANGYDRPFELIDILDAAKPLPGKAF
jgi:hypothetical protein